MEDEHLLRKVSSLCDLELAFLLSLVAREHCLISTPPSAADDLVRELCLISSKTFSLEATVVSCHQHISLDDFAAALLLTPPKPTQQRSASPNLSRSHHPLHHIRHQHPPPPPTPGSTTTTPSQGPARIANVVLARNLDRAPRAVQIQALELIRTRRILTRTAVHAAPRQFLLVAVLEGGPGRSGLTPHLNDLFYFAHWHDPEQGFVTLEEQRDAAADDDGRGTDADNADTINRYGKGGGGATKAGADWGRVLGDGASTSSMASGGSVVVRANPGPLGGPPGRSTPADGRQRRLIDDGAEATVVGVDEGGARSSLAVITEGDMSYLAQLSQRVRVDVDVVRYQMNIISFLRMHRAVAGPVTPTATKHLERLAKSLAPLQGLDFVTGPLVAMAARKVYLHRINAVTPERERSMQWGSDLAAIEEALKGVGPEEVIEEVLEKVTAPV